MYFQIRDFVLGCVECQSQRSKKAEVRSKSESQKECLEVVFLPPITLSVTLYISASFFTSHILINAFSFPINPAFLTTFTNAFSHIVFLQCCWSLCFRLTVFTSQEPGGRGCVTKTMASHSDDVLSKLRSQREAGLFCDITLRTNGRPFLAHRAVLAAVSDHFQEIFTEMDSNMKADIDLTGKNRWLEAKLTPENIVAWTAWGLSGWILMQIADWACILSPGA